MNSCREEFLCLCGEGKTRSGAAVAVRADARSAIDWGKGIKIIHRGRVYPGGRVVRYLDSKLSEMTETITAVGGKVSVARVEQVIDSRYLSIIERERLCDMQRSGISIRVIAAELGRSPSTMSRELRRNTISKRGYMPHTAHRLSVQRRRRPRESKLVTNDGFREYVREKLRMRWSPEQISHRIRMDFPDSPEMRVSTETIYQAIYVHLRGTLKREMVSHLRRGRKARKPNADPNRRCARQSHRRHWHSAQTTSRNPHMGPRRRDGRAPSERISALLNIS